MISIITPVYNVEKYLKKCIDSILSQSYKDFELIIVDDGSPDDCGKIADNYAKKDKRVKVIHKENGGAPSARNAGIKIAKGDYLYFPDSDDWLENDYLEKLVTLAEDSKAELIVSGFVMEYYENNKSLSYDVSVEETSYLEQDDVRKNLHRYFNNMMMAVPWNKLYKADYIKKNSLQFPNLKWDDLHFNMDVIMDIKSVAISSSTGYHFFRSRAGSETTKVFDGMLYKKRREQFEHIMKVYEHWQITDDNIMSEIYGYYAARLIQCVQEISISEMSNKRELVKEVVNDDFNAVAIKRGNINSKILKIAIIPMKLKNITLSIIMGIIIGFCKNHMTSLFYKVKSVSVNKANLRTV